MAVCLSGVRNQHRGRAVWPKSDILKLMGQVLLSLVSFGHEAAKLQLAS
jgi:hypothetical protein